MKSRDVRVGKDGERKKVIGGKGLCWVWDDEDYIVPKRKRVDASRWYFRGGNGGQKIIQEPVLEVRIRRGEGVNYVQPENPVAKRDNDAIFESEEGSGSAGKEEDGTFEDEENNKDEEDSEGEEDDEVKRPATVTRMTSEGSHVDGEPRSGKNTMIDTRLASGYLHGLQGLFKRGETQ